MKDLPVLALEPPFVLDRHQVACHHLPHDDDHDDDHDDESDENDDDESGENDDDESDENDDDATTFPTMTMTMRMMRMMMVMAPPSYDISGCVSAVSPGKSWYP